MKSDRDILIEAYGKYFDSVVPSLQELNLANSIPLSEGWGKHEFALLGRVLPNFCSCEKLSLAGHSRLDDVQLKFLAQHLCRLESLRELHFEDCGLTELGVEIIQG